jgi:hypothetical protein
MATTDTPPTGKKPGKGDTAEVEEKLEEAVAVLEAIDWSDVRGMTASEATALSQRLAEAREQTTAARPRTDGGQTNGHATAAGRPARGTAGFDERAVAAGDVDDTTVWQAVEGDDE